MTEELYTSIMSQPGVTPVTMPWHQQASVTSTANGDPPDAPQNLHVGYVAVWPVPMPCHQRAREHSTDAWQNGVLPLDLEDLQVGGAA